MLPDQDFRIAIDIGGTFTDCVLLRLDDERLTTKALTTTGDPSKGVIDSLEIAAIETQIPFHESDELHLGLSFMVRPSARTHLPSVAARGPDS